MDRTVTAAGGRLLERRISSPSRVLETIQARLNSVTFAFENGRITQDIREHLRKVPDLDRALSRLSLDRGGPRDLAAIRNGLTQGEQLNSALAQNDLPELLNTAAASLLGHDALVDLLDDCLLYTSPSPRDS